MYGDSSEHDSFEMGEPDPNYVKEVETDDENSELSVEDDDEDFVGYAEPHNEAESIANLEEMSVEFEPAGQEEISSEAIGSGFVGLDSFATFM